MLHKIMKYVKYHEMIETGDRIVAGVSGGADSVCLFFILLALKNSVPFEFVVVHVNHGIRGAEADGDEEFVKNLCEIHKIPFFGVKEDVILYAHENGLTEEEAGRNIRYRAFEEAGRQYDCNKTAVAHNKNDQAETVLFHLFRGSGIKGLSGILPVRDRIIRPLLCVERFEIEAYLKERKMIFRTDCTNLDDEYTRNKIRHHVIPFIKEQVNEKVVEHIYRTANMLHEADVYIQKNASECFERMVTSGNGQYSFNVKDFCLEDIVIQKMVIRYIIYHLVHRLKDIDEEHISMLCSLLYKQVGKSVHLPYGIYGERGYEDIVIYVKDQTETLEKITNVPIATKIVVPGKYYIDTVQASLEFQLIKYKKNLIIPKNRYTKWFDYDKIDSAIFLRTRIEGDYMQIDAKGSTKKIKNIFIDNKVPKEKRDSIPLLADDKHIMWIIGDRISEAYKVDEGTERILVVELVGGKEDVRQDKRIDF